MKEEYEPGGTPSKIQYFGDENEEVSLDIGGTLPIPLSEIRTLEMVADEDVTIHPNCRCSIGFNEDRGGESNV